MTKQQRLPSRIPLMAASVAALLLLGGTATPMGAAHAAALVQQNVPPPPPVPPVPPVPPPADPNAPSVPPPPADKVNDIIAVASGDSRLSALVKAIQAAGLTDTLSGKTSGPYTLFGPLNSAFSRLPNDKYNSLLKPENKAELVSLLKGHIVSGRLTRDDLTKMKQGDELTTLAGTKLRIGPIVRRTPTINGAAVVAIDILADNGVIHIINAVLVPSAGAAPAPAPPADPPADAPPPSAPPVQ
ncbi:MAG: fasciclin domain-containing protein [Armatimonadota bacterium]